MFKSSNGELQYFDLCLNRICHSFMFYSFVMGYADNYDNFFLLSLMQNPNEGDTSSLPMGIICYDDNRATDLE